MLDLKAQLAAAGLVTKEEVEAAEAKARNSRRPSKRSGTSGKRGGPRGKTVRKGLDRAALTAAGKGERYEMVRRAVTTQRLDSSGPIPSAESEPFHFAGAGGAVGRVFVEARLRARLEAGTAAIVGYMSNHGLAHAVVPAELARDIAAVFPEWLRVLRGHSDAPTAGDPESA